MKKAVDIIKKMLYILNRPQKILCMLVFVLTIVGSLLECLGVTIIIPVVTLIMAPDALLSSSFVRKIPFISKMEYSSLVIVIIGAVILLYIIKNVFFIFMSWVRVKFSCKIQRENSVKMMESYMSRGYQFFLNKSYGELNRGVSGDVAGIYRVINAGFKIFSDFLTITFICIFMFVTDLSLSLVIVAMSLVCILLIYFVFRRNMYTAGVKTRVYSSQASQALLQAFSGIKDVLIMRKQRYFVREYEDNTSRMQMEQAKSTIGQETPAYIIESMFITGVLAVVGIRIAGGGGDSAFVSTLAAFAVGAFRILPGLGRISVSTNQVISAMPSVDALYNDIREAEEYVKTHPEVMFEKSESRGLIDKKRIKTENKEEKHIESGEKFHACIELRNITFAYSKELDNILEHVNLTIQKGQSVAFIGASGTGKSTLVDVLLGLLIPDEGGIYMDGIKITEIPELWSQTIGYVSQSIFLSSESILENVAFGEEMDKIDKDQAWEAIERAELGDFVRSLPNDIMTRVGDRGVRLSGGQRQRIAIARALYHRPDILVLDEATSALDNDTEAAIMEAINALQGHVTLIIVAHRLTTVRNCDIIYEVKDKNIIEKKKEEVFETGN